MFYCDTNANRGDSSLFLIAIRDRYLLIPVNPWHVLYSNPDIALCGPDLCSSVMWLRVMIRDRIFFFLRSPRIPSALEKEGEEEGIVARKDRFRNVSGWAMTRNWAGNRSVSRAIIPRTSGGFAGEIFHRNVCTRGKNSKNWSKFRLQSLVICKFVYKVVCKLFEDVKSRIVCRISGDRVIIIKEYYKSWCLFIKLYAISKVFYWMKRIYI